MTTPTPAPDDLLENARVLEQAAGELLGTVFLLVIVAAILTFALLRAASKRPDAMIVVSLSLLTLVAIVGFMATQAESLVALAGAGVGALAGAVTNLFSRKDDDEPPVSEAPAE